MILETDKLLPLIRRAATLFRGTPGRKGAIVHLDDSVEEVMVVGDLHGNLAGFARALRKADLEHHPHRHLVLQELVHGKTMYPEEGGDQSHQLVDAVCALKCRHPRQVHLILGNHELAEVTGRRIAKGGNLLNELFFRGLTTAHHDRAAEVHRAYQELFTSLPVMVRAPNRILICHTIPEESDFETFNPTVLETGRWTLADAQRGGTIYALTWGRDFRPETVDRFAHIMDADLFINGHTPCPDTGFQSPNHRQLIIDGTLAQPAYCLFPTGQPLTLDDLVQRAAFA
ncbi:metallophosphoesterase [Isosphaera pallida ATCC 43644]|uniref:protein-serine/threonine phosphatase n=1 Tax=Isosphaera pallida (strain ATCC 43644 / DSM 9630 / IS1B) TaxID=575540 RepID=E8R6U0_ISOPI|nr:metallophosphoesterase [Isosphaera pallida]ADV63992.1 metallophosphoesterase [Isosphaera pallida ATCC 43644]